MKKARLAVFLMLALILALNYAYASQTSSTTYKQNVIVSEGGENASSSSYSFITAVGIINGIISSTSFTNQLGFFHFLLLANNQPCTTASQCEGGFCCSNLCKSSACPTSSTSTSSSAAAGGGGGGGGGGGAGSSNTSKLTEKSKSFRISPDSIKTHMALGAAKTETLTIKNTGEAALSFNVNIENIGDFIFLTDSGFSLEPGEEKVLELNVIGKRLGSYIGQIIIKSGGIERPVDAVVEVDSENALFDAKIDIPSAYKEVQPGNDIKAQITLLNVGPARKVDVTTNYLIKDRTGKVIYESSETFAVEKQTSFVKSFKIPASTQPGDYLAIVELRYEKSFAVSSELFKVVPKEGASAKTFIGSGQTILILFAILVGAVFLFAYLLIPGKNIFKKFNKKRNR